MEANVLGAKLKDAWIEKEKIRTGGIREYYYIGIKLHSDLRGQNQALL